MGTLKLQRFLKIEEECKREGQRDEVWGLHHSLLSLKMVKRTTSSRMWAALEPGKGKEISYSLELPEESSPVDILILAQWALGQVSNIQKCKIIKVYGFKPL